MCIDPVQKARRASAHAFAATALEHAIKEDSAVKGPFVIQLLMKPQQADDAIDISEDRIWGLATQLRFSDDEGCLARLRSKNCDINALLALTLCLAAELEGGIRHDPFNLSQPHLILASPLTVVCEKRLKPGEPL